MHVDAGTDAASGYRARVVADQPLGYWRLGDGPGATTMADVIGNHAGAYHGMPIGGAPGALVSDPDTATSFAGSGEYGVVASGFDLANKTPFTIELWLRPDVIDNVYRYALSTRTNMAGWGIFIHNGEAHLEILQGTQYIGVSIPLAPAMWQHLVFTYDANACRGFLDGAAVASQKCNAATLIATGAPLTFGALNPNSKTPLMGTIDEVAVYDRVLEASTISAHYAAAHRP